MNILGQTINWQDAGLIKQALTHRSRGKHNNERLEFLGDSILSLVVSNHLYNQYQQLTEGELSRLRSQLVKGKTLAAVARHYNLGPQIILGPGEIKSGGVNKSSVLADAVEAVFGAVYLDQGYVVASQFIEQVLQPWLQQIDPTTIRKDAKSELQEILQKQGLELPEYQLMELIESNKETRFKVSCEVPAMKQRIEAIGGSIKKAEQSAASKMIEWLLEQ
ncbi:ribonuclease III [Marinicella sediminis]|uniref:Ribonuclease 3 n=1 Tax=Marinicella sediminis TaxID=1792834 RepID=A0ABV7J9V6_9GAMM|nr:ribonuclease III [Marinicella sediminis]